MIEEDYVSFETAKLLKEKGFNEPCFAYYSEFIDNWRTLKTWKKHAKTYHTVRNDGYILVPTLQMAMKWLREWYYLYIILDFERPTCIEHKIYEYDDEKAKRCLLHYDYEESYEEAYEEAIKYCLENLI